MGIWLACAVGITGLGSARADSIDRHDRDGDGSDDEDASDRRKPVPGSSTGVLRILLCLPRRVVVYQQTCMGTLGR